MTRDLLLTRRGIVFVDSTGLTLPPLVRAFELELAALGFVLSDRLRSRLLNTSADELTGLFRWVRATLLEHLGGNQKHEPLFRNFPDGVPADTEALYWKRVLVHYFQAPNQPCLHCRRTGTTHVLNPCTHVVCDHCFDGSNYSGCPICNRHVDQSSPFFKPSSPRDLPKEAVRFKLLDLGGTFEDEAKALFQSFALRAQAMSPQDVAALRTVVSDLKSKVYDWLPPKVPVRENTAHIFGTLFSVLPADEVLPVAKKYLRTATDVLRFLAVISGADAGLLGQTRHKVVTVDGKAQAKAQNIKRFAMAKLSRGMRRFVLALLDALSADSLVEDMLRHRSYWIWAGEFLHPGEYSKKFPNAARAFQILRTGELPDGTKFRTWKSRITKAVESKNISTAAALLSERPGELARAYDYLLRADPAATSEVIRTFQKHLGVMTTPVLLLLHTHLATRTAPAAGRVYFPKAKVALGVYDEDKRPPIAREAIDSSRELIRRELLARFAKKPRFSRAIIDRELERLIVPFSERSAARAAVVLPRGSRITIPAGKLLRLFMHWCEPETGGHRTDLDLSIGFYNDQWAYAGVCAYYTLKLTGKSGAVLASSSGDRTSAPFPDGASEFIDLHRDAALAEGMRYAVFVVNNYSGMAFSALERGFAGIMFRDDAGGDYFDPRTVELKFSIDGENGVFAPLVVDLQTNELHWLDVHAKGNLAMNNVSTSNKALTTICPKLIEYFGARARPSLQTLLLLHAAARCDSVYLRGETTRLYRRRAGEDVAEFHARICTGQPDEERAQLSAADNSPIFAGLYRGTINLPAGSSAYALFRENVTPNLSASDLLS